MTKKISSALASAGLLLTAAIWGFAFVIVKDSLDTVPPLYMLAVRFTIAGCALALICCHRFRLMSPVVLRHGFILGCFLFTAYAFQTIGCQYTTAGKNAFLTTVYVVLVPLFLWGITGYRPGLHIFAAAVLALAGIGLLSLQNEGAINTGDILTLICGVGYALHIIFISRYNRTEDAVLLTVLQLLGAAALSWILAPLMEGAFPAAALRTPKTAASMLYLGLASTMLAFFLQNICQKYAPPATSALLLSFESVFGVIFAGIFLHEHLSPRMAAGCVLLFVAVVLAETKFSFITEPTGRLLHRKSGRQNI